MRAMFAVFYVAGVLATVGFSTPLVRQKRGVGAFTAVGSYPFSGAFAAAGMNPFFPVYNPFFAPAYNPYLRPAPVFNPFEFFPPHTFDIPTPWYERGEEENVCKIKEEPKIIQIQDDPMSAYLGETPNVRMESNHETEQCRGNAMRHMCVKRMDLNSTHMMIETTKYECCPGYVRNRNDSPACTESSQATGKKLTKTDQSYYTFQPVDSRSSSRISSSSSSFSGSYPSGNVDKVPIQ